MAETPGAAVEWAVIKDFRSIYSAEVPLDRSVVLVGANGAGKSNVLEAIARKTGEHNMLVRGDDRPPSLTWIHRLALEVPAAADWLRCVLDSEERLRELEQRFAEGHAFDRAFAEPFTQPWFGDIRLDASPHRAAKEQLAMLMRQIALLAEADLVERVDELLARAVREPLVTSDPIVRLLGDRRVLNANDLETLELLSGSDTTIAEWAESVLRGTEGVFPICSLGLHTPLSAPPIQVIEHYWRDLERFIEQEIPSLFDRFWTVKDEDGNTITSADSAWKPGGPADGWAVVVDVDAIRPRPWIRYVLDTIEQYVNDWVPSFVSAAGSVRLGVTAIAEWNNRPKVTVSLHEHRGDKIPYELLSAGIQRWIAATVRYVCRVLRQTEEPHFHLVDTREGLVWEGTDREGRAAAIDRFREFQALDKDDRIGDEDRFHLFIGLAPQLPPGVLLIDEPELHLHPAALQDVVDWIAQRTAEGQSAVIATHSPRVMRLGVDGRLLHVHRMDGHTVLTPVPPGLISAIDATAADMGFGSRERLGAIRGILAVEGPHDRLILERFYGDELRALDVLVLPLGGHPNAMAILEAHLLRELGTKVIAVFDNLRANRLNHLARPGDLSTDEEQTATKLRALGADVRAYEEPDIICALPPAAVRRAYPHLNFKGWDELVARWRANSGYGFKGWAFTALRLQGTPPGQFIERVLDGLEPGETASAALQSTMNEVLAEFDEVRC
jgi:hypothetical protein